MQVVSLVAQMVKHLPTMRETRVQSPAGEILWRRKWQPTPVVLPGKSHGRNLVGYSPWGRKESDTTERLDFTSLHQCGRHELDPWVWKIPWRRKWLPTPVFLPGKSHGQRSLAGYSPCSCKEPDTT